MLAPTADAVDRKKVQVRLITPLDEIKASEPRLSFN